MKPTLVFSEATSITLATNIFINVPVILQYEDTPLIEVVKLEKTNRTTQLPIYNLDGEYLAKVVGTRIFKTEIGEKAGLQLRYPKNMTVCELNGKTIFEIKRDGPAALSITAELFTPDGAFIKAPLSILPTLFAAHSGSELQINGITMTNCTFRGLKIGIKIMKNGGIAIGVS